MTKSARSKIGIGQSARGYDQGIGREPSLGSGDRKIPDFCDSRYIASQANLDTGLFALLFEHGDDFTGTFYAENLTRLFFVISDMVLCGKVEDVARCKAGEGRLAKVRILGKVMVRGHVEVREIAPSAAGYAYLRACPFRVVEHQ